MHHSNFLASLFFWAVVSTSCNAGDQPGKSSVAGDTSVVKTDTTAIKDTIRLTETFYEADIPVNEYLTEQLRPIRENFKQLNSITSWSKIDTKELWESTEGGEARYYYQNGALKKIVARHFGETFQMLTEYYLLDGQLSFVYEKTYRYNRPIYYDSLAMKENQDTEAFDMDKSEIEESRNYFEKGKLLHQLHSEDCGAPFASDYLLEEQIRFTSDFSRLLKLGRRIED